MPGDGLVILRHLAERPKPHAVPRIVGMMCGARQPKGPPQAGPRTMRTKPGDSCPSAERSSIGNTHESPGSIRTPPSARPDNPAAHHPHASRRRLDGDEDLLPLTRKHSWRE